MTGRQYVCPGCGGTVGIPSRRRNIALDAVRAVHDKTCPGRVARRRHEEAGDE